MSNNLRTEKNCLNCGSEVPERFCSHCGQENIETKETFMHQLQHVIGDITHFDSKFFRTVKYLFSRPGFLTMEYLKGKRVDYVRPIQLFVFTSFLFFLVQSVLPYNIKKKENKKSKTLTEVIHQIRDSVNANTDSIARLEFNNGFINVDFGDTDSNTTELDKKTINLTEEEYIRIQDSLPVVQKDSWLKKKLVLFFIKNKNTSNKEFIKEYTEKFMHKLHYWIFLLFPFFALIMKLFYRKKQMYFTEHLIFGFHFHTIILLAILLASIVSVVFDVNVFGWALVGIFVYLFISLLNIFNESKRKTFVKSFLVYFLYFIVVNLFLVFTSLIVFFQ